MIHLTEHELDYFARHILAARRAGLDRIANPDFSRIRWGRLRESVLGQYSHIRKRITLNIRYRPTPEYLVSTLCHELHHRWQHETMGAKYILLANFITRDRYLEGTAREIERKVDKLLGMDGLRDGD